MLKINLIIQIKQVTSLVSTFKPLLMQIHDDFFIQRFSEQLLAIKDYAVHRPAKIFVIMFVILDDATCKKYPSRFSSNVRRGSLCAFRGFSDAHAVPDLELGRQTKSLSILSRARGDF